MKALKGIAKIFKKIVDIVLTIFVILFVAVVCLQRFSNNELSFFNYRIFTVVSGSMVPKYNIGDVLISKDVDPNEIKVGDAVSYLGTSGSFKGKVITHEVIDIETDADGKLVFHTKGLANIIEDPIVYEDQVYGVVTRKAVLLSFVYRLVGTQFGLFLFVVIPILYIVASEMIGFMLEKEEERRKALKDSEKSSAKKDEEDEEPKKEEKKSTKKTTKKKSE